MNIKLLTLILIGSLLASCASTTQYVKFPDKQLDENFSRIYVLRPSSFGSAVKMSIYENDKLVGKLGPKSYLKWDITEEEIRLYSKSENKDILTIKPVLGKTYYIKQQVKMGIVIARTGLVEITEEEAKEKLKKLKKPKVKYIE